MGTPGPRLKAAESARADNPVPTVAFALFRASPRLALGVVSVKLHWGLLFRDPVDSDGNAVPGHAHHPP